MNFISPEPLFAQIKETTKSYFDANLVDDTLFPSWLNQALGPFKMGSYALQEAYLKVVDHTACLPEDIHLIQEVRLCHDVVYADYQLPNAFYYQKDCRVTNVNDQCEPCFEIPQLSCDPCDKPYVVTHKIANTILFRYSRHTLLFPSTQNACSKCLCDVPAGGSDTYDIQGDNIIVPFPTGNLYLQYYGIQYDDRGNRMIPDEQYTKNYIEAHFYYKIFEQIFHISSDETFNQAFTKLQYYKQLSEELLVEALSARKLQSKEQIAKSIVRTRHRYDNFKIPTKSTRYGR